MSATGKRRATVVGPRMAGTLMTTDEFDAVRRYDDRHVYELIRGVLAVSPIPSRQEVGPNEELGRQLLNYGDGHPQGSSLDLTLPERYIQFPENRRRADRVIWAGLGRVPAETDPPTIAVEFVSKAKRDRVRDYVEKRA